MNFAYSLNEETYSHGGDTVEAAIAESIDAIASDCTVGDEGSVWIGEEHPWDEDRIAGLMTDTFCDDYTEERIQERFYDETLCEDDEAICFPNFKDKNRNDYEAAVLEAMKKIAHTFGIKARWFTVENPKPFPYTIERFSDNFGVININARTYIFDL